MVVLFSQKRGIGLVEPVLIKRNRNLDVSQNKTVVSCHSDCFCELVTLYFYEIGLCIEISYYSWCAKQGNPPSLLYLSSDTSVYKGYVMHATELTLIGYQSFCHNKGTMILSSLEFC